MSGFCGICHPGGLLGREGLEAMTDALTVKGDLHRDLRFGESFALGVARRWPGQQCGKVRGTWVAVDAELTNLPEVDDQLKARDLEPSSMSVAERIGWLYLLLGSQFIDKLHGVFSLAVWDEANRRLILAIDRLGVRSLYWKREKDLVFFSTRVGAIRAGERQASEIHTGALAQFLLFSAIPAPLTSYENVEKLCPGYMLVYEDGRTDLRSYWDIEYSEGSDASVASWAHQVRDRIRSAVRGQLEDCVPQNTGAYLSGGTDSSSVVAFMSELHSPVRTFSIFFEESAYSEAVYARTTAERFRTVHHELVLTPSDASALIPQLVQYYDEPLGNSSAVGAYACARLARQQGVDTLLAGDGGDELFAGNERYASDKYFALYSRLPSWLRIRLIEPLFGRLPLDGGLLAKPRRYILRASIPNPKRIFSYNFFLSTPPEEVFEPAFLSQSVPNGWLRIAEEHFCRPHSASELNRLLYLDVKMILADNDLRKVVGTAELAGVRARFPLLDHRLVEFAATLPTHFKLRRFEKRYIFKKGMSGVLPERVLRKKKHGFGVPVSLWLLQDPRLRAMADDILRDAQTRQRGYFRPSYLDLLLDRHRHEHPAYYGEVIWHLLMLELWHREHSRTKPAAVMAG